MDSLKTSSVRGRAGPFALAAKSVGTKQRLPFFQSQTHSMLYFENLQHFQKGIQHLDCSPDNMMFLANVENSWFLLKNVTRKVFDMFMPGWKAPVISETNHLWAGVDCYSCRSALGPDWGWGMKPALAQRDEAPKVEFLEAGGFEESGQRRLWNHLTWAASCFTAAWDQPLE